MDPLDASLAAGVLFNQVQQVTGLLESLSFREAPLRDVKGDLDELKVHLQLLAETVAFLDKSSTNYPPSTQTALARCMSQQTELTNAFRELKRIFEKGQGQQSWSFRAQGQARLEPSLKRISEASNALCKSILLFVQLVTSLKPNSARQEPFWNRDESIFADTGRLVVPQEFANLVFKFVREVFANLVFKFLREVSKYGNIGFSGATLRAPSQTRLGRDVAELVIGQWNVTFTAGLQDGIPCWGACRAKPDTGCNGNWIKRNVVERAGLLSFVTPVIGDPLVAVDASDHKHLAKDVISLTWYRNEERTSRKTDFFIIETGPYEMLFGVEFIKERLERLFPEEQVTSEDFSGGGTILAFHFKPMKKEKRNEFDIDRQNFEQRNRELAARGQDEEDDNTQAAENVPNNPVPAIAGIAGGDTDSMISVSSKDTSAAASGVGGKLPTE